MTIEVSRSVDSIAFYEPEELAHFFVFYGAYRLIVSAVNPTGIKLQTGDAFCTAYYILGKRTVYVSDCSV